MVAAAIGGKFGVPSEALAVRIEAGRFRVKADVDIDAAKQLASELESMGAVCSIVGADGQVLLVSSARPGLPVAKTPSSTSGPSSVAVAEPEPAVAAEPELALVDDGPLSLAEPSPVRGAAPVSALSAAMPVVGPAAPDASTGLGAAQPGESSQDLGVLSGEQDMSGFSLETLDGEEEEQQDRSEANLGPSAADSDELAFMPPEAARDEKIQLAEIEVAPPRPSREVELAAMEAQVEEVSAGPPSEPLPHRVFRYLCWRPRARLVSGILIAMLVGFIPAHLYASVSWTEAHAEVVEQIHERYAEIEDLAEWDGLDEFLAGRRVRLEARRYRIGVNAGLFWLLAGGLLGFAWQRFIPWDD